jgi:glycosyltransferase involved in cell wall biosynthesis
MKSNNSIQFSIITPVYNRADCIKRCMGSIKLQTFNSYEFIIIDDGSTDETLNEIKTAEASFSNIKVISYPENKGVNYARNRGIEQATGKFIIFLDSDDWLSEDALIQIDNTITQNPVYQHYLFGVSDRINDKTLPKTIKEFQYKDWLSGIVTGDFAHVIQNNCFKDFMFIEQFRIYEALNWFRILRNNKKQLFIPIVVSNRERERADSVSIEATLDNKISMQNAYNFLYQFIEWYKDDFTTYNIPKILQKHIKSAFIIGLAIGEKERNNNLIDLLENSSIIKTIYKIINHFNVKILFYNLIKSKSKYNQRRRK